MSIEPFPRPFERREPVPPPALPWAPRATPSKAPEPRNIAQRWWRRWRHRRAIAHLTATQPDSVLRDVGLSRADALYEAQKPFWMA